MLAGRLHYAPEDENLVRVLVGDALLVSSAADGLALLERHPDVTAVALDGTVIRPGGIVSGGSGDDVAAAMVEQKREMHALTDDVETLSKSLAELVDEQLALRARMTDLGTSLDRAREPMCCHHALWPLVLVLIMAPVQHGRIVLLIPRSQ